VKEGAGENGGNLDVTPQEFAVRSLAQEYGGGAFAVQGDVVVFSNYSDQRLYKQTIGGMEEQARSDSDCFLQYLLVSRLIIVDRRIAVAYHTCSLHLFFSVA
jgi:hypothetical protein